MAISISADVNDGSVPGGWELSSVPSYYHMLFQRRGVAGARMRAPGPNPTVDKGAREPDIASAWYRTYLRHPSITGSGGAACGPTPGDAN